MTGAPRDAKRRRAAGRTRDAAGRFDVDAFGRRCRCGHVLALHYAGGPRACGVGEGVPGEPDGAERCGCPRFRAEAKR